MISNRSALDLLLCSFIPASGFDIAGEAVLATYLITAAEAAQAADFDQAVGIQKTLMRLSGSKL